MTDIQMVIIMPCTAILLMVSVLIGMNIKDRAHRLFGDRRIPMGFAEDLSTDR